MRATIHILATLILLAATTWSAGPAGAEGTSEPLGWCGAGRSTPKVLEAQHRFFERQLKHERLERQKAGLEIIETKAPKVYVSGETAVIEDNGRIVRGNLFDLSERALLFKPERRGYKVKRSNRGFSSELGERLDLGDDDSAKIDFPTGFRFPFFSRNRKYMFVNSDGSITFREGDSSTAPRDLFRFLMGPPRIAALYADLDPGRAEGEAGIYYKVLDDRVRITWWEIPVYKSHRTVSVQVHLFSGGRLMVTYGDIGIRSAIIGISPGDDPSLELQDFSAALPLSAQGDDVAIAEHFEFINTHNTALVKTFFQHFKKVYDQLIVWLAYPDYMEPTFAYHSLVRNDIDGIGSPIFDRSDIANSGPLQSYIQMGSLAKYADEDFDEPILRTNSTMDILGHEVGHRWLARVRFLDAAGVESDKLLGRQMAHWSFLHDTDGSLEEGNDIRDNGDGTFTTVDATVEFSDLDRYLMGLIPPGQVRDFFYVESGDGPEAGHPPEIDVDFAGQRVDVSIDDVIAAEGERVPSSSDAPTHFSQAFVLVGPPGVAVSPESIDKLERIRQRWLSYFSEATGGLATVDTELHPRP